MINKPLAIANKPFRAMNVNPSKERSFYTQGQRIAARILLTAWLLASCSPGGPSLARPGDQWPSEPQRSFYTQAQQCAARILWTVWLLVSGSPGDPSLASTPPTPRDQLPSEPLGSAVVAPSTATQSTLQQLMSQHSVPDNNNLLAALDVAPPQEQSQWIDRKSVV